MEFLFELLPIALILLWTFLGLGGRKKRQGGTGAPQRRPETGTRQGADVRVPGSAPGGERTGAESGTATGMLPEDLWAVLTGEADAQGRARAPDPYGVEAEPYATSEPEGTSEPYATSEPDLSEGWLREPPDELREQPEPGVVSMEGFSYDDLVEGTPDRPPPTEIELSEARHDAFHERLEETRRVPRRQRRSRAARELGLTSRAGLRRGVVLQEVLGTPKGLQ